MANEKHLLLTAIGDYTAASMAEETWAVTVRLALVFGPIDPVGTLPSNWEPVAQAINRRETNWTITGNWKVSFPNGLNPDDYLNDTAAPAFATWAGAGPLSNQTRIRELKLFPCVSPLGKSVPAPPYSQGSPCLLTWTSNYPVGSTGSGLLPPQIALAASHRTQQIGRRGRGRMFMPGINPNQLDSTTGEITSAGRTNALNGQVALLEALKYDSADPLGPHIAPVITGKPFTNYGVINTVRVGSVFDTQRRRRRSVTENYIEAPVT